MNEVSAKRFPAVRHLDMSTQRAMKSYTREKCCSRYVRVAYNVFDTQTVDRYVAQLGITLQTTKTRTNVPMRSSVPSVPRSALLHRG